MKTTDSQWWQQALCVRFDPDEWNPGRGQTPTEAVAACGYCPVRQPCLADAVEFEATHPGEPRGVRGGLTARQRRPLVSRRRKQLRQGKVGAR